MKSTNSISIEEARSLGLLNGQKKTSSRRKAPKLPPSNALFAAYPAALRPILARILGVSPPQFELTVLAIAAFGDRLAIELRALNGRKIELDLAIPDLKLGIEVNGWANHGKSLDSFTSDHERTQDLMIDGWVILPITAGQINANPGACIDLIRRVIDNLEHRCGQSSNRGSSHE